MSDVICSHETIYFNSFTSDFQGKRPQHIVSASNNAYITMGNYADTGWTMSIQIRNPKVGDTVIATWNDNDDNPTWGVYRVTETDNGLEIIAELTSEVYIAGSICRRTDVYRYEKSAACLINTVRDTVRPGDHAF